MRKLTIVQGDCRKPTDQIPDGSVHCVITSPPYWKLRDYNVDGQIGLESTPEEFIANLVAAFREVKRCLRDDGTLWLNLGDIHVNKSLLGLPWRVALALVADGWILRQWMPWVKRNTLPESAGDRPSTSCETIFLFAKTTEYFYDGMAVKRPSSPNAHARLSKAAEARVISDRANGASTTKGAENEKGGKVAKGSQPFVRNNDRYATAMSVQVSERNRRNGDWFFDSDWQGMVTDDEGHPIAMVVNAESFKGEHFAPFPKNLVQPCILAGTSARGCCPACGAQWTRVVEDGEPDVERQRACGGDRNGSYHGKSTKDYAAGKAQDASATKARILAGMKKKTTVRWEPKCACFFLPGHREPVPSRVLDPFFGTGTTGEVAIGLGRDAIGRELNPDYVKLAEQRTNTTMGLGLL